MACSRALGHSIATRYYPPDLDYVARPDFLASVLHTLQMSLLGGFFGVARSRSRWPGSPPTMSRPAGGSLYPVRPGVDHRRRAIHETIWTVLFVMIFGFGSFSGMLALTMFCIGFAGKLFSRRDRGNRYGPGRGACAPSGPARCKSFTYAVLPQVRVAFVGIAIYTWDVAFRAATVVGFFGGGGMGLYLKRTVQQLETNSVAAILLTIIALVCMAELLSGWLRHLVQRMR